MTFDSAQEGRSYLANFRESATASLSGLGGWIANSVAAVQGGAGGGHDSHKSVKTGTAPAVVRSSTLKRSSNKSVVVARECAEDCSSNSSSSSSSTQAQSSLPFSLCCSLRLLSPRVVLWKSFEEFEFGSARYTFLVLGLIDGFQIFHVQSNHACRLVASHSDAPPPPQSLPHHYGANGHAAASAEIDMHLLNQKALASTPIGFVKFITHPANLLCADEQTAQQQQPPQQHGAYLGTLLAVASAEDRTNFPRSVLKIYSLAHQTFVHLLRFRSRIFGVHTHPSSHFLVVALENEMHVYRTPTASTSAAALVFECVWSTKIMPNPSPHIMAALAQGASTPSGGVGSAGVASSAAPLVNLGPNAASILATGTFTREEWSVLAISKRWVAYCINEPVSVSPGSTGSGGSGGAQDLEIHQSPLFAPLNSTHGANSMAPSAFATASSVSSSVLGSSAESLKGLASGLYNLGGMGKKSLANYLSGETQTGASVGGGSDASSSASAAASSSSVLGSVLIRDLESVAPLVLLRAHPGKQVTHLAFDRSGTLLATVPQDGQYIHVYQIVVVPQPKSHAAAHTVTGGGGAASAEIVSPQQHASSSRRSSLSHSASHSPMHAPSAAPASAAASAAGVGSAAPGTFYTRFLYRLFRGITHASIRDLSFSFDARYLSVVSAKGTTHVYAINPTLGGDITAATHGPQAAARQNKQNQQMVAKMAILAAQTAAMQQGSKGKAAGGGAGSSAGSSGSGASSSSSGGSSSGASSDDSGLVGLDSFLYAPKTLSAIYRIKPSGSASAAAPQSGLSSVPPMYNPVIACFARLPVDETAAASSGAAGRANHQSANDRSSSRRGSSDDRLSGDSGADENESTPHHLMLCTWNEQLTIYSLSTALKSGSGGDGLVVNGAALQNGHDASPDSEVIGASDARAKLTLLVTPLSNFDLAPTAIHNTSAAAAAAVHHSRGIVQQQQQPHQQQLVDESTVRILRHKGEEDQISPRLLAQQQQQQRSHSPMLQVTRPAGPLSFFQELEADRLFGPLPVGGVGVGASSSATAPAAARSALSSHSPIFAALATPMQGAAAAATNSRDGSPKLSPTQEGASWLSEVELRTYETSDVPLWASPQVTLCSYEASVAPSQSPLLFIERLGSRPLVYKKNREWEGMNVAPAQPRSQQQQPQSSSSSSAPVSSGVESDITAALSSSMLNDAGFMAALRGSDEDDLGDAGSASASASGSSSRLPRSHRSLPDEEGLQSSQIYGTAPPGGATAPGSSARLQHGHLMSGVNDNYYLRVADADPAPAGHANGAPVAAAAPLALTQQPQHPPPHPALSPVPAPVPTPSPHSSSVSDSEILGAQLPPSKSDDSLMLPAASAAAISVSPQPVSGGGGKKKKKSKSSKLKVQEMAAGGSNAASDQDD